MEMLSIHVAAFVGVLLLCFSIGGLIGMLLFALIIVLPKKKTKSKTK